MCARPYGRARRCGFGGWGVTPQQQQAPHNKHREFMSHHPPVFTNVADPLEVEDWLKTVLKMLTTS
jgi:hypothetical protein